MAKSDAEIVLNKQQLCDRLNIGESTFKTLIEAGMPGRHHKGKWFFYLGNVERWYASWSGVSVGHDAEEAIED